MVSTMAQWCCTNTEDLKIHLSHVACCVTIYTAPGHMHSSDAERVGCKSLATDCGYLMQALQGSHANFSGIMDLKSDNLVIKVAADGTFVDCTVLDLGGSTTYCGEATTHPLCITAFLVCVLFAAVNASRVLPERYK